MNSDQLWANTGVKELHESEKYLTYKLANHLAEENNHNFGSGKNSKFRILAKFVT